MTEPIRIDSGAIDLTQRIISNNTIVGSPATNAETTILSVTIPTDMAALLGVIILWTASYTVGTSGTAVTYKVRRTGTSGATVATSGATTAGISAGNLVIESGSAFDNGPTLPGQVYVVTMTVTGGAAASTVSAANIIAIAV